MGDDVLVFRRNIALPSSPPKTAVRVSRIVGVCLLMVAALGYCGWLLQFPLPTELPVRSSFIAELSAAGRPYDTLFRVIDFGTGAAALASTPFLARLLPVQLMPRLTVMAIALFGILMLLSGGLTLDCAPSVDDLCAARGAHGSLSATHTARWGITIAVPVVFVLGTASAERWFARGFWRNGLRCGLALVILAGAGLVVSATGGSGDYLGLVARIQAFLQAATLFFGAVYILDVARATPRTVVVS